MAEKFGIGGGPHELKIGSSFAANGKNGKFHTIRYDFKPASLDPSLQGVLDVGESNSINVKLPHTNGTTETNYSGHMRDSSQKECVLIIDRNTGEITLEKLSGHMQLKKTRQERPEKSAQIEKYISAGSVQQPFQSSANTSSSSNHHQTSSSSRPQTPIAALKRDSPAGTPKPISRSASPHIPNQQQNKTSMPLASVSLSESSSSSSSSGSDSDSDLEDVPFQSKKASVEPSMPSFLDSEPVSRSSAPTKPTKPQPRHPVHQPPAASMPQILNDDLQLSESDDDSD